MILQIEFFSVDEKLPVIRKRSECLLSEYGEDCIGFVHVFVITRGSKDKTRFNGALFFIDDFNYRFEDYYGNQLYNVKYWAYKDDIKIITKENI